MNAPARILHTATGPIPASLASRSPFAGVDVCEAAGWDVLPGSVRPRFDEDLWDMTGLAKVPRTMRTSSKRWDFGAITNPRWRLTAKEYIFALAAPHHEKVLSLPNALRDPFKPQSCNLMVLEASRWLNFLTAQGIENLAEVMQEHCDAYKEVRSMRTRHPSQNTTPLTPGALVNVIRPVQAMARYGELFTADAYAPGFTPWAGRTASEVAAKRWTEGNTTPPVPDEVFQPAVAAALYIVETLGPLVAAEQKLMFEELQKYSKPVSQLKQLSARSQALLLEVLDWHVRENVPFTRLEENHIKKRIGRGWDPKDPLLEVNTSHVSQRASYGFLLSTRQLEQIRPEWEAAVAQVGIMEELGRSASLVPRHDDPQVLVPWTLPISRATLRHLVFVVLAACRLLVAALSGMRASELDELTHESTLPPATVPGGTTRYRLASRVIKQRELGGVADEWVVLEPAYRAVQLASQLNKAADDGRVFPVSAIDYAYQRFREWVNGTEGQRLGLTPIPSGPVNGRMLRRTVSLALAHRPGGLLAAKIHLKHLSVVTTEGYAARPGGSQAALLAEATKAEKEHHLQLTADAYEDYRAGRLPSGPGARDLIAAFEHIDAELKDHAPGAASVLDSERRLENLLRKQAQHLHVQAANYCWFRDPSKALCLKLAGTPAAKKPLAGMCDAARCPQATHHPCHLPVWKSQAEVTRSFLGNPRFPKGEKARLKPELERAQRVVDGITAAAGMTQGEG
ncbi:hypothetical protein ACWD4B_15660 [Streptomyces sp. NPDC002536]